MLLHGHLPLVPVEAPANQTVNIDILRFATAAILSSQVAPRHLDMSLCSLESHLLLLSQAIGAAGKRAEGEAAEAASSAYRDELVCTLLATVDHHPWGARCHPSSGHDRASTEPAPRC